MADASSIRELIEGVVEETLPDGFIVELLLPDESHSSLVLLVDTDKGITIDECARLSRKLGFRLDEENIFDTPYQLEVSSPGLNRPLRVERQYRKNIGRKLKVVTLAGQVHNGQLVQANDEGILLGPGPQKPKNKKNRDTAEPVKAEVFIKYSDIKEAKVKISMNN